MSDPDYPTVGGGYHDPSPSVKQNENPANKRLWLISCSWSSRRPARRFRLLHQHPHKGIFGKQPELLPHRLQSIGIPVDGNIEQRQGLVQPARIRVELDASFENSSSFRGLARVCQQVRQALEIFRRGGAELDRSRELLSRGRYRLRCPLPGPIPSQRGEPERIVGL